MSLVVYPTTNYDAYMSIADTDTMMANVALDNSTWTALTDPQKEFYIKQATTLIKLKITEPDEDTTPFNLQLATAHLINFSLGKDMTNDDGKSNVKKIDIDGAVSKEFFSPSKKSNSFPDIVASLLYEYGFTGANSFRLVRS